MEQERNTVCLKGLILVNPNYARKRGLIVEEQVFVSNTDSTEMKPPIYQVGRTTKVLFFDHTASESFITHRKLTVPYAEEYRSRPKSGMGYFKSPLYTEDSLSDFVNGFGLGYWVAVIEPLGLVKKEKDPMIYFNRSTDELRIKRILAICKGCSTVISEDGLVVDVDRSGSLYPVCGLEIHGEEITSKQMSYFKFSFDTDGKIIFT